MQIVKQSAAASVQPSSTVSNQGSPSVPASVQASVPVQQSSPSQPSTVVSSNSVSSSPQASAIVQGTSGVSPKISPQPSPAVQQVVPQYSPVDGQDQYGRWEEMSLHFTVVVVVVVVVGGVDGVCVVIPMSLVFPLTLRSPQVVAGVFQDVPGEQHRHAALHRLS